MYKGQAFRWLQSPMKSGIQGDGKVHVVWDLDINSLNRFGIDIRRPAAALEIAAEPMQPGEGAAEAEGFNLRLAGLESLALIHSSEPTRPY